MTYDSWKTQTPDVYDFEEGNTCRFCGEPIEDGKRYCDIECYKSDV